MDTSLAKRSTPNLTQIGIFVENNLTSKTISYLRFPLMVGIVLIHFNISEGFAMHGITYGEGNPEWYRAVIHLFSQVLPTIGVPLFFFFSGFLFFYHTEWSAAAYKRKLKSRARTLLVPYFLWNIIAALWAGFRLLPFLSRFFPVAGQKSVDWSLSAILNIFWDNNHHGMFVGSMDDLGDVSSTISPIDGPLWYVRDLIIVVVFAPLVFALIKRLGWLLPTLLGLAWYVMAPFDLGYAHQLVTAFFFFSWGACFSIRQTDFTACFRKLPWLPLLYLAAVIADTATIGASCNIYIHDAGIVFGVVSAIIIVASLLEKGKVKVNQFLAGSSFFIFALHVLIMHDLGSIVFSPIRSGSPIVLILFYFFIPVLTILICLALYKLLKKYLPGLASLLTGGR